MTTIYSKDIHVEGKPIRNLFAKEYEDARDAAYLKALKLNKGFDAVAKFAFDYGIEKQQIYAYTGSAIRVTDKNMPYLYYCVSKGCQILGLEKMPEVYVINDPVFNAFTVGSKNPILVLHNSIIKQLTHEELMFIIGHELGHIKSEHCQYHYIGSLIVNVLSNAATAIPMVGSIASLILSTGLGYAYYDWSRKSEFTADRAGLLCCQDLTSAITAHAKMSGYPEEFYETLDANDMVNQAMVFEGLEENLYTKIISYEMMRTMTHPWTVERTKELLIWVQKGEYSKILMRCSDWLRKEHLRIKKTLVNQEYKMVTAKDNAEKAAYEQEIKVTIEKEPQNVLLRGVKSLQNKVSSSVVKAKQNTAEHHTEKYEDLVREKEQMEQVLTETDPSVILSHIEESLGELNKLPGIAPSFVLLEEKKQPETESTDSTDKENEAEEIFVQEFMYCPSCGQKIEKGSMFCPHCGIKVENHE